MNIKKYEAFIRAVELGSLSKAAEELGYTQSGISHMMQSLEEEVGFPLLVRTSSGILPNAEGETLLPAIRRLLRTNDALAQTIAQIGFRPGPGDRLFQRGGLLAAGGDLPFPAGFPPCGGDAPGGGWRYDRRGDGGP